MVQQKTMALWFSLELECFFSIRHISVAEWEIGYNYKEALFLFQAPQAFERVVTGNALKKMFWDSVGVNQCSSIYWHCLLTVYIYIYTHTLIYWCISSFLAPYTTEIDFSFPISLRTGYVHVCYNGNIFACQKCHCKEFVHSTNEAEAHSEQKHWSVVQKLMLEVNIVLYKSTGPFINLLWYAAFVY